VLVWRERSRGFVLPPAWDPASTVLRSDPFRRRYEKAQALSESGSTGYNTYGSVPLNSARHRHCHSCRHRHIIHLICSHCLFLTYHPMMWRAFVFPY